MEVGVQLQRLCHVQIQRLLFVIGIIGCVAVLVQLLEFPYELYTSSALPATKGSGFVTVESMTYQNSSKLPRIDAVQLGLMGDVKESDKPSKTSTFTTVEEVHNLSGTKTPGLLSTRTTINKIEKLDVKSRTPLSSIAGEISSAQNETQLGETQSKDANSELLQNVSSSWSDKSFVAGNSIINKRGMKSTSISEMTISLLRSSDASESMRPQWSSPRDRELQFARSQMENAPILRTSPELYASLFRNVSMFKRSYELMERMLKVYVYKEGDKPVFHQPHLRGIYASEGWFMKLIEGNKQFVTRDPRKAHLFYLSFSSLKLRSALQNETSPHQKHLQKYLKNYTDNLAKTYRFWNRTKGADHFLVACHDWAPRMTRENVGSCIRALCNTNVARGFRIGKDVSLPVTYIRTSQDPHKDLGGKPPSERPILAFFAGGMHGYLRPMLLKFWENKEPDMKIVGPMPRDIGGKTKYRDYMKSSKYCICARGYEVHTPRIVEAIYFECVPVIISDNYVPPFFEVLDWEAFSVFVLEKDIPNLRNILVSIPEEMYIAMQQRVKMVQRHFLWHKKPVKYDLFHMILHSVWYNRVFQSFVIVIGGVEEIGRAGHHGEKLDLHWDCFGVYKPIDPLTVPNQVVARIYRNAFGMCDSEVQGDPTFYDFSVAHH